MIIRKVKEEDIPQLFWDPGLREWEEHIIRDVKISLTGEILYLVAERDGKIIGQIKGNLPDLNFIPYMSALRVVKTHQNQGAGTQLIHTLEKELKQKGYKKVSISVALDNPNAKRLYERLGYQVVDQRRDVWDYTKNGETKTFSEEVYDLEKDL